MTGASCLLLAHEMDAFVCCNKEYCYISSVFNIISIFREKFNTLNADVKTGSVYILFLIYQSVTVLNEYLNYSSKKYILE